MVPFVVPTSCAFAAALMDFEPYEESGKPRAALINVRDSFRCSLRLGLTLVWVRVRVRAGFGARVKVKDQTQ